MKKEQVLIVEDDADIRDGVRILLERRICCYGSGRWKTGALLSE